MNKTSRARQVVDCLDEHGAMTSNEILEHLTDGFGRDRLLTTIRFLMQNSIVVRTPVHRGVKGLTYYYARTTKDLTDEVDPNRPAGERAPFVIPDYCTLDALFGRYAQ